MSQKNAYFVVGAEDSGNRMMVSALVSAGCYGDGGTEQRLDDLDFTDKPDKVALLRSIPHGADMPNLLGIARKMQDASYRVRPILMYRKTDFVVAGQTTHTHAAHRPEVREHIQNAICGAYSLATTVRELLTVVVYELFVILPQIRRFVFTQLGLPAPEMEFYNANEKYELTGPPLVW